MTTKYLSAVAPVNEYYQAAHRSRQERKAASKNTHVPSLHGPHLQSSVSSFSFQNFVLLTLHIHQVCKMLM